MMARAFIGVGSNIAPGQSISEALRQLAQSARMIAISTFYRQPALGHPDAPEFINGVVAAGTDLPPLRFKLDVLRRIEDALGRRRDADEFAPRTIDLDLLLYGDQIMQSDELPLPHPDILKRAFVAIPLDELEPALVLPGSGIALHAVVAQLSSESMEPLHEYSQQLRNEIFGPRN